MANADIRALNTREPVSVRGTLAGKHVLVTGTTGFLGKVWLSQVLHDLPEIGHLYLLVRGTRRRPATKRVTKLLARNPAFRPLRDKLGEDFADFVKERVTVLQGDCGKPMCGLKGDDLEALLPKLDAVVHFAGLTDFDPDPSKALSVNVDGTAHVADLVEASHHAKLVHCSTCFVAGNQSGVISEAWTPGVSPKGVDYDHAEETAKLRAALAESDDGFDDHRDKEAVNKRIEIARDRALALGWPNIYVYTKSLAESLLADRDLDLTIVRPAIVECSTHYPFAGWNEGINTSGPLVWLLSTWFRHFPSREDCPFDVVPVDAVSEATTLVLAAHLEGKAEPVYQLGTSQTNLFTIGRAVELQNLANRRELKSGDRKPLDRFIKRYFDVKTVGADDNHMFSFPRLQKTARRLKKVLGNVEAKAVLPRGLYESFGDKVEDGRGWAVSMLGQAEKSFSRLQRMMELYRPFVHDNHWIFATENIRALADGLTDDERRLFGWHVDEINWRAYWMDVVHPGLHKWSIPLLRGEEIPMDPPMDPPLAIDWDAPAKAPKKAAKPASSGHGRHAASL